MLSSFLITDYTLILFKRQEIRIGIAPESPTAKTKTPRMNLGV